MYYLKNNTRKYMMYSVEKYILSDKLSNYIVIYMLYCLKRLHANKLHLFQLTA